MTNIVLALRRLFKNPVVTSVAIVSLALGLGANTAIFSLFDQILLRPLPVDHPERLVNFADPGPNLARRSCNQAGGCDEVFSYPMFRDLSKANKAFTGIAGHVLFDASIAWAGAMPVSGDGVCVSGSYFPVLAVRPALGRLFGPADDDAIGANDVAVVSYAYWASALAANPSVIGSSIIINGRPMRVVGVAPQGFTGTTPGAHPLVFVPLTMRASVSGGAQGFYQRDSYWLYLFGRLKPGATVEQAQRSVNGQRILLSNGSRGQSLTIRDTRAPLTLLIVTAGILLSMACANIASLLLTRAANRTTEMAVRLSLGATRGQLVAQVLTESLLLSILGGAVSILVTEWTLGGVAATLPAPLSSIPFHLDLRAFGFTAAVSLGAGLLFGIAPALESARPDLLSRLRNNQMSVSPGRAGGRLRAILVSTQIALAMALLISAGLFIKSLRNVSRVDLGLRPEHVIAFGMSPMRAGYDVAHAWPLYDRVHETVSAMPGVTGVTESVVRLVAGSSWGRDVSVEGYSKQPGTDATARFNSVGPAYFHVLGIPLVAGRDFVSSDDEHSTPVAIINEAFARKFQLGPDPIGKRMSAGNDSLNVTIVGVAKDWAYSAVKDSTPPVFVRPYRQAGGRSPTITFYLRTVLPPELVLRTILRAMTTVAPTIPVEDLETLSHQVDDNLYLDRAVSSLSEAFAVVATLLAAIGLYGMVAYSVTRRTREIGLRMALGASGSSVHRMILRQVGGMTLIGGTIGLVVALALGRVARSMLFELEPYDPVVIALAVATLAVIALGSALVPAKRAGRIDPMEALRHDQ